MSNDNQGRGWDDIAEQRVVGQLIAIFVIGVLLAAVIATIVEHL
jgi:hypothetical protein